MKKPGRFEGIVLAEMKKHDRPGDPCIWLHGPDVVTLLRKEHQAVVRMVKKELEQCRTDRDSSGDDSARSAWACRMAQCYEILDHLTRRAR